MVSSPVVLLDGSSCEGVGGELPWGSSCRKSLSPVTRTHASSRGPAFFFLEVGSPHGCGWIKGCQIYNVSGEPRLCWAVTCSPCPPCGNPVGWETDPEITSWPTGTQDRNLGPGAEAWTLSSVPAGRPHQWWPEGGDAVPATILAVATWRAGFLVVVMHKWVALQFVTAWYLGIMEIIWRPYGYCEKKYISPWRV